MATQTVYPVTNPKTFSARECTALWQRLEPICGYLSVIPAKSLAGLQFQSQVSYKTRDRDDELLNHSVELRALFELCDKRKQKTILKKYLLSN